MESPVFDVKNISIRAVPMAAMAGAAAVSMAQADRNINHASRLSLRPRMHRAKKTANQDVVRIATARAQMTLCCVWPVGTVITDINSGEMIADLTHDGEKVLLAQGGIGGLGNIHFKNPAPTARRVNVPLVLKEKRANYSWS